MNRAKRPIAVAILGAAVALLMLSTHASAASTAHPVPCLIPPCPTPTADHHGEPTPTAAASDTPTATAQALALATPVPTPPLPDTGFAESNLVSQGQNPSAPVLTGGPPPAVANYAAAPGFGDIGIPLLIVFALVGSGAFAVRRKI